MNIHDDIACKPTVTRPVREPGFFTKEIQNIRKVSLPGFPGRFLFFLRGGGLDPSIEFL